MRKKRGPNIQNVHEVYEKNKPNKTVLLKIPCPQVPVKFRSRFALALVFLFLEVIIIFKRIYNEIRPIGHFMDFCFSARASRSHLIKNRGRLSVLEGKNKNK